MVTKKIFILGTVGSGKSTLAKRISNKLKIPTHDLDHIFFAKTFNKKRNEKSRDKKFKELCKKKEWIIEGVYSTWIEYGIKKADLVILLKIPKKVLFWRITKRTLKREKSKKLGKERYQENFKDYLKLLRATKNYYNKKFTRGYYKHKELINTNKIKFVALKNNKQINEFLKKLK